MMNFEKRCGDCACLIEKNGTWCCDECFGQLCSEIDDCPEGFTVEEVEKAESVKAPKNYVKDEKKPKAERKPREKKIDDDKLTIINLLRDGLVGCSSISDLVVVNDQKEITFSLGGSEYSVSLTKHRPPKK